MNNCLGVHLFHKDCLENQLNSSTHKQHIKCAICGIVYGKILGEMPKGQMTWSTVGINLGFPGCYEAIQINYQMPSGKN